MLKNECCRREGQALSKHEIGGCPGQRQMCIPSPQHAVLRQQHVYVRDPSLGRSQCRAAGFPGPTTYCDATSRSPIELCQPTNSQRYANLGDDNLPHSCDGLLHEPSICQDRLDEDLELGRWYVHFNWKALIQNRQIQDLF